MSARQHTLIQAVHDRTAGNPFFAQQIARLLAAQGTPLDRAPATGVPPAVGDVLARRLARLPGPVVDLLAVASVVGRRFPITLVAAMAGVPAETALPLLDSAVRAAVLEQDDPGYLRFSHDLFREVVYAGLPAARRSALHLSVAGRLEHHIDAVATAAEVAYHRSLAWPLGDRTGRSPRWPRRPGKRPPGPPSTRRPPGCAGPSTSPATRQRLTW